MTAYRTRLSILALMAMGIAFAQEKEKTKTAAERSENNSVEVRFADDSVVKMSLLQSSIDVATRYGRLTIPMGEIRRIEFGRRIPDPMAKRIDAAMAKLGDPDVKQRDAASAELIELKEYAYPALQQAAKSSDPEVSQRAKLAMKSIGETVPADRLHASRNDTIIAVEFTVVGHIETPTLKARTPYFGDATLKLAEMKNMRWLSSGRESKLMVDAVKYGGQQNAWLDTGIEIRSGATLQVLASGRVEFNSQNGFPGGATSVGPDGQSSRGGRGGFNPNVPAGFQGRGGRGGPARGGMSAGALVGRIGENGAPFFLGSRYSAPAHDDGKLYLRIVPIPGGAQSSGSYEVRINAGR